jgi:carbonic anhydrase
MRRSKLVAGQEPFAIILGCSDSRIPAEIVFDQGLGDLFVISVAGNIVAPSQIGSVEFGAERFGTRLVVVLGHSQCGAVRATLEELHSRPTTNRGICVRSSTVFDHPWRRCCRQSSDTTRKLWCDTPFGHTSASLQAGCDTGRKFSSS